MTHRWFANIILLSVLSPAASSPHRVIEQPRDALLADSPAMTPAPFFAWNEKRDGGLWGRQDINKATCGFLNGDPNLPRSAERGFNCRVDTERGLWGFCPQTVIRASDCGLAGNCVDTSSCSTGCGLVGVAGVTTFTCATNQFCSTVLLALGRDADFSYIACGGQAITETLFPTPFLTTAVTTTRQSSTTVESTTTPASAATDSSPAVAGPTSSSPAGNSLLSPSNIESRDHNNLGAIIGGVLGGIALVCLSAIAIIYIYRRSKNTGANGSSHDDLNTLPPKDMSDSRSSDSYAASMQAPEYPGPQYHYPVRYQQDYISELSTVSYKRPVELPS